LKAKHLACYLLFKQSAIQVDAIEAVVQGHITRARALNKERSDLANNIRRVLKSKRDAAAKAAPAKAAAQQDSSNSNATSGVRDQKKRGSFISDGWSC